MVERSLAPAAEIGMRMSAADLLRFREVASRASWWTARSVDYAVALADATRRPGATGCSDIEPLLSYGASPRGPIGLVQSARALALLRGRRHVLASDIRDLAPEVLRHRLVLSYEGAERGRAPPTSCSSGCSRRCPSPTWRPPGGRWRHERRRAATADALLPPAGRQGPRHGARARWWRRSTWRSSARAGGVLAGEHRASGVGSGTELAQLRPYQPGDDVRQLDPAATARTGIPHVRQQVPERLLTTWLALDVSASMAFGTADRLKSDVAEGVVRRGGHAWRCAAAGGWPCSPSAAPVSRLLPPRGGRGARGRVAPRAGRGRGSRRTAGRAARRAPRSHRAPDPDARAWW